jgi:hypothetical protein
MMKFVLESEISGEVVASSVSFRTIMGFEVIAV